jgi:protein-disulfide isomerase
VPAIHLRLSAILLSALVIAAPVAAPAAGKARPAPAHVARDWSKTVVATPEGGFRMGNPAARMKLVEYGSLTCSHCADFARTGVPSLISQYVKTGKASYEYRNFVLNGIDVTATLLARCAGPSRFFGMTETLYATQREWVKRFTSLSQADKDSLKALTDSERLVRMGELGGLTAVAARYGVAAPRAAKCLSDKVALDRLGTMAEKASALGVQGTPTFLLNGQNIGTHDWTSLEPVLRRHAA